MTPAAALEKLQQQPSLKLLAIAETLSPKELPQSAQKRNSAVSDDSEQNADTNPAALEADLAHYKVPRIASHNLVQPTNIHRNSSVNCVSVT